MRSLLMIFGATLLKLVGCPVAGASDEQGIALFRSEVRELLSVHCLDCHGGDAVKGDLDLSTREALVSSGFLGDSAGASHFMQVISHTVEPPMPHKKEKLPPAAIEKISEWIDLGAPYDKPLTEGLKQRVVTASDSHWAFRALERPALPEVENEGWISNPIDRFVLRRLEDAGRAPAPPADVHTMFRRVNLDLLGLPPAPEAVEAFVRNPDWAGLVDGLLESPHFGERYGRHWLDVARFADSTGYGRDYFFPHAARYRDYVIQSMNADKPFDEFVKEQIAGDVLYPADTKADLRRFATGFYTVGAVYPVKTVGIQRPERFEYDRLTDAADVTGEAFLALSVGCARCHNHKYDPITQRDYFALQSYFASTRYERMPLEARYQDVTGFKFTDNKLPVLDYLLVNKESPGNATLFTRGELESPAEKVAPRLPGYFEGSKQAWEAEGDYRKRRLELAKWIVSETNPLTARVIANRVWQWHFGEPLVSTPNDFGLQGDKPATPELLDYLASYLVENGWSLKKLHRHILNSSTYRMGGEHEEEAIPGLIDRYPTHRMQAETIWDSLLVVSGKLNRKMFGPAVFPPIDPDMIESRRNAFWPVEKSEEDWMRRGIYVAVKRSMPFPFFETFNSVNSTTSCGERSSTIVSPQALLMMNGEITDQLAQAFLDRLMEESGGDRDRMIERAWMLLYGRAPRKEERAFTREFLKDGDLDTWCLALLNSNEFIYVR